MGKDWIEKPLAIFADQAKTFCNGIAAEPLAFGIPADLAALLAAAYGDFVETFAVTEAPSTRTTSAILARDCARKVLKDRMRRVAARIRANGDITDQSRINLAMKA